MQLVRLFPKNSTEDDSDSKATRKILFSLKKRSTTPGYTIYVTAFTFMPAPTEAMRIASPFSNL
jgi:hypothetical protein